jgi:hypothetical protein
MTLSLPCRAASPAIRYSSAVAGTLASHRRCGGGGGGGGVCCRSAVLAAAACMAGLAIRVSVPFGYARRTPRVPACRTRTRLPAPAQRTSKRQGQRG